jgi:septal ring factor EnvC (AmiA/AmiB activator)
MRRRIALPALGLVAVLPVLSLLPKDGLRDRAGPADDAAMPVAAAASEPVPAVAVGLERARAALAAADPARPVDLARALGGLDAALAAYGSGLAGAEETLAALEHAFRRDEAATKRLLAALIAHGRVAETARMTGAQPSHPAGPVAAARAAILLAAAEEALGTGADDLAARLGAIAEARALREKGLEAIEVALAEAERARALLAAATGSPAPAPAQPAEGTATLAAASGSLTDLGRALAARMPSEAAGGAGMVAGTDAGAASDAGSASDAGAASDAVAEEAVAFLSRTMRDGGGVHLSSRGPAGLGLVSMPVAGRVLRGFKEPDAAGSTFPGLTLAAAPRSVVTAPIAGLVTFLGPFLDYGTVLSIAGPGGDLVLLAGIAEPLVEAGMTVDAGAPLGLLGGRNLSAREYLMLPLQGKDPLGAETLYMEYWRAGRPIDPAPWLGAGTVAGLAAQNG